MKVSILKDYTWVSAMVNRTEKLKTYILYIYKCIILISAHIT